MKTLEKNHNYSACGSFLSKILLFEKTRSKHPLLVICADKKTVKKYCELGKDINILCHAVESIHDLGYTTLQTQSIGYIDISSLCNFSFSPQDSFCIQKGMTLQMEHFIKTLQSFGYLYHEYEKPGSYIRKGDSIRIYFPNTEVLSIHFWGDDIEDILLGSSQLKSFSLFSLEKNTPEGKKDLSPIHTMNGFEKILCVLDELDFHEKRSVLPLDQINYSEIKLLTEQQVGTTHLSLGVHSPNITSLEDLKEILSLKTKQVHIYSRLGKTVTEFLEKNNLSHISFTPIGSHIPQSFVYDKQLCICDDILSSLFVRKRSRKKLSQDVDLLLKIQKGDHVVHIDHGIGIFEGIIEKVLGDITKEFVEISYQKNEKLFVPITELQRISKYVGSENPQITPLGGKIWEKKIAKVQEDIQHIAEKLLENFAQRNLREKQQFYNFSSQDIGVFQSSFPFTYTLDQEEAVTEILGDLKSEKNMDRLLIGDVGFGKTEVAFNAAFAAIKSEKQVALIAPLVVLACEHFEKSLERFKDLGYNIVLLTRLQSQKEFTQAQKDIASGKIHMVVGTHRVLSQSIKYKNLGLLIVDEEHKFGVQDKEKIKNIQTQVDILSLSATPIPRSLNLALSGVRDISILKTAPKGRKSIETSVIRSNDELIYATGKRELERGGQIFFIHNRVQSLAVVEKYLQGLFTSARIGVVHGQLPGEKIEDTILDFKNKKYDILLATTVIENGIDFPNVNTIFINNCEQFGISQIHQLRGRVGRSDKQGYCYLLYKKENIDGDAAKRIQTIVDYSYLGAGFELAMKDLEVRGGGDILGIRQSGQSKEIGMSLFLKMLEEKIDHLKSDHTSGENHAKVLPEKRLTKIDLLMSAHLPEELFQSQADKIAFYRELELINNVDELKEVKNSFQYDDSNKQVGNFFLLLECQIRAREYSISSIKKLGMYYQVEFYEEKGVIENLKSILQLDTQAHFSVLSGSKIRTHTKYFAKPALFLEYFLSLLRGENKRKIKLVKR